jgi:GNAT superfamily N-acetyltransferase
VSGASRTFVVSLGDDVLGYYCLAAGAVTHDEAPGSLRRNMPDPIPIVVLGRLAVHSDWQGQGIGAGLLKDAILRTVRLSEEMGIRAIIAHALHDHAKEFYLRRGFVVSPIQPLTVMLNVARLVQNT